MLISAVPGRAQLQAAGLRFRSESDLPLGLMEGPRQEGRASVPQKCGHRVTALCLVCTVFTDGLVYLPKQILQLHLSRRDWEAGTVHQSGP